MNQSPLIIPAGVSHPDAALALACRCIRDAFRAGLDPDMSREAFLQALFASDPADVLVRAELGDRIGFSGPVADPISPEIQALIVTRRAAAMATDPELDGFAMEMLDPYGFARAPDAVQPDDDPDMLDVVYVADGRTLFNMMCVLGYKRTPPRQRVLTPDARLEPKG